MDVGVYVLLERRVRYVLVAKVQPDIERALQCVIAVRPDTMMVPVTRETIKAVFLPEEVQALGGQPAARMIRTTPTDQEEVCQEAVRSSAACS